MKKLLTGLTLSCLASVALATPISEVATAHDTLANAQVIDGSFSLGFNPDIGNSLGANTSTTIPNVSISGNGADSRYDMYRFHVNGAGVTGIFDIDYGMYDLDANLRLFNASGASLAYDDDYNPAAGAGGSVHSYDSFIQYNFASAGDYFIRVGRCCESNLSPGQDYVLQVSIQDHATAVPEPASLALLGLGIFGLAASRRRK